MTRVTIVESCKGGCRAVVAGTRAIGCVGGSCVVRDTDARRTLAASDNPALLGGVRAKNNGRHWATPPEVFAPLHAEFDFTLDPCATPQTAKCPRFYTEADDGLSKDWTGERVFMNPPYGREIYPWTRKARTSGALVVVLLPASCDLAWWHDDVVGHAEVRYLRGRVRFLTGGPYRASGFFASVIVIWRPHPFQPMRDYGRSYGDAP